MSKYIEECKKHGLLPKAGASIRIKLDPQMETDGFLVNENNLKTRKNARWAKYWGPVLGAGGDLWWVKYKDGTVAACMYTECF